MKNRFDNIFEFSHDLMSLVGSYEALQDEAVRCKLKAALYKAYFYNKDTLAKRLETQLDDNRMSQYPGGFDGFGYDSRYMEAVYRTLHDMLTDGLISQEDYDFCNV